MSTCETVRRQFALAWPMDKVRGFRQIVAVSGGSDSVALLRLLLEFPWPRRLVVAHFDHRLRPESAHDCRFVGSLAKEFGLEFRQGAAARAGDCASEAVARTARYRFLREQAQQIGARYVITGHTADDQVETILHRVIRGTGPRGLCGIRRVRSLGPAVTLVRPLLSLRRSALLEYLRCIAQDFRHDATNWDPRYTRNRLRHELIPLLEREYNAGVVDALLHLGHTAGEMYDEWHAGLSEKYDCCVRVEGPDQISLGREELEAFSLLAVTELLVRAWRQVEWPEQAMGFQQWRRLAQMATLGLPSHMALPGGMTAEVDERRITIRRAQST